MVALIEDTDSVGVNNSSLHLKGTRMTDPAETIRRQQLLKINIEPGSRADLESRHGQVWDTTELQRDFSVEGFLALYVVVRRNSDGRRGSLRFQHSPRFYFSFSPE